MKQTNKHTNKQYVFIRFFCRFTRLANKFTAYLHTHTRTKNKTWAQKHLELREKLIIKKPKATNLLSTDSTSKSSSVSGKFFKWSYVEDIAILVSVVLEWTCIIDVTLLVIARDYSIYEEWWLVYHSMFKDEGGVG